VKISEYKKWYHKNLPHSRKLARDAKRRRASKNLCLQCKEPALSNRRHCKECAEKARQRAKRIAANRWEDEECIRCGKPNDDLKYSQCSKCREKNAQFMRNKFGFNKRKKNERTRRSTKTNSGYQ